ncbi:MAG: hypothetical protein HYW08_13610, partial [candidate division NC10 bacterium]|nr:hypothetical protein [candidate division NC10 bacterium]
NRRLTDLTAREVAVLVPVLLFIVWIGIYPRPFLATTEASVKQLLAQVHIRYRADGPRGGTPPIPTETGKAGMGPRVMDASREPRAESREPRGASREGPRGGPARISNVEFRISNLKDPQSGTQRLRASAVSLGALWVIGNPKSEIHNPKSPAEGSRMMEGARHAR